jgi:hypothetical protein
MTEINTEEKVVRKQAQWKRRVILTDNIYIADALINSERLQTSL